MSSDATEGTLHFLAARRAIPGSHRAESASAEKPLSDEELLLRLRSGDEQAFANLFERHSRMALAIGYRLLRDRTEAEELVQETFLYVRTKASLFDPAKGAAKAWIMQVAYHRALDRRVCQKKDSLLAGTNLDEIEDSSRGSFDIEQQLGARYDAVQLKKAFAELSERQRATLELFFFEGLSLREIADRLDESLENVRHYYYRSLGKLRKSSALRDVRKEREHGR